MREQIELLAKEYLKQAYMIDKRIKDLQRQRDNIRNDMYSIKSPTGNMQPDKVQSSITGDALLKLIAKVDLLERDIVRELDALVDKKKEMVKKINALEDARFRTLLFDRYILFWSWEQIAVDMNYRIKWVYQLHGKALAAFAEKWGS